MSDKKQSSVDWLSEQTYNAFNLMQKGYITMAEFRFKMIHFKQRAKAMHESEIQQAFDEGNPNRFLLKTGEQYYNETFGGNNETTD